MINKIDSLLEQLDELCNEFDYIADAESNWHTACRIGCYREHVERGFQGLREMREYLATRLTECQLEQLQAGSNDEPDLIVETKRTKRDSINLKLNGKRISLTNLEDQVENSSYFSVINQYGKEYSCYPATTYGYFGESPEGYTIHFNTLGELIEHYAVDNIIHTAEPADNPTNDTQDTDQLIDPPVYNPFTIEEEIDMLNHNINWATETLATMQGDIYSDDWQDWTRSELEQAIEDWTEERDDLIIKSGKLTFNHQQKKNLRDSLNRAIKQCIRNRIGYLKSHNPKMEKYEYELLCLLQGARRELEVA